MKAFTLISIYMPEKNVLVPRAWIRRVGALSLQRFRWVCTRSHCHHVVPPCPVIQTPSPPAISVRPHIHDIQTSTNIRRIQTKSIQRLRSMPRRSTECKSYRQRSDAHSMRYRASSTAGMSSMPYPVVAGMMVHPALRKPRARPVEQDPPYQYPCAWGV